MVSMGLTKGNGDLIFCGDHICCLNEKLVLFISFIYIIKLPCLNLILDLNLGNWEMRNSQAYLINCVSNTISNYKISKNK